MPVIKKTVAIHPIMDSYIRKIWSLLVESGYDATYSTALNFMLLGAIFEATQKKEGWSEETRRLVWSFMEDEETIKELNLEDQLANLTNNITLPKEVIIELREKIKVKERSIKLKRKTEGGK
ncbi:MAG: hypothetical protein DRO36_06120 [Candidatus Hecatellales archaeon]|nr:MAG: hypothetical protein DRO36_06120 [Candidatus Hecatellales archaeon]